MATFNSELKAENSISHPSRASIGQVWAVGRNYGEHAKELGHAVPAAESDPMIFLKAASTLVAPGAVFPLPTFSADVHYECEVALRFGPKLEFTELTVALDLTARDIQSKLKAAQHPWTLAKSFKNSCPLGPLVPIPQGLDLQNLKFELRINGDVRQSGTTADMIHPIEKMRRFVIERFPVEPGDLLLTGTPAGVGQLKRGDRIDAEIKGLVKASWSITAES